MNRDRVVLGVAMLTLVLMVCLAGCGDVTLKGEALKAAELSTMDAYQALQRAKAEDVTPSWQRAYLQENFCQWRWFVRAARNEKTWGPKLEGE